MDRIDGAVLAEEAARDLGIRLVDLIALASVWVSPEIYKIMEPAGGTWYPERRRANLGKRVDGKPVEAIGQVIDGITLDSNNYANVAFKTALGVDRMEFIGFHICHIWGGTVYDAACFTNIANLVGMPAALASLTDHHFEIIAALKFRSWELYGWKPAGQSDPVRPSDYPAKWREPWPANDAARRSAQQRVRSLTRVVVAPASEHEPLAGSVRMLSSNDATDAAMVAAFYLSKFDHERLAIGNQGETFDRVAKALGVKRPTLKHYRDYFDSHTGSHREGWKAPLPPGLDSVFQALRSVDEATLRKRVLEMVRR